MRTEDQNSSVSPLVILLDIDGTLIGNISPQLMTYELVKRLKHKTKLQYNVKELQAKLNDGIIRPHFKQFFEELTDLGIEIFIYTASEKKWAEFIIKQIETCVGVKFNRPLFTRNNCELVGGKYMKKISFVRPMVIKALQKKYNKIFTESRNRIVAIDNRRVYAADDEKYLILCSTYKYRLPDNVPLLVRKNIFDENQSIINNFVSSIFPSYKFTTTHMKFEKQFYQYYVAELTSSITSKPDAMSDIMFKIVKTLILNKNISSFTPEVVQYINKNIYTDSNDKRSVF